VKAIKFNLSGKFAHFKKPDVNSYAYFTYSHIHKIAVLGILGSILGLKGYNQFEPKDMKYPEFYEKLKDFRISIIPKRAYFTKKIQTFNNSVGYASKEEGGNLIVREQWLENVSWDVLVLENESSEFEELKGRLLKKEFVFIPYLGKNDFPANIDNVEIVNLQKATKPLQCISLVPKNEVKFIKQPRKGDVFYYEEYLPIRLKEKYVIYEFEKMVLSSMIIEGDLFEIDGKGVWCG
jgi:CRISPR-associated protein Cas5h